MTDISSAIDRYLAIWNETDPGHRRDLIVRTWSEDARYVDPLVAAEGHDGIEVAIAAVQAQFPGLAFRRVGEVDAHHNLARFSWELVPPDDADALVIGFDVAVFADDGRLQQVHGFLDKAPAL